MISREQCERALKEFAAESDVYFEKLQTAKIELANYAAFELHDKTHGNHLADRVRDADYMAESRAWIADLIRHGIDATWPAEPNEAVAVDHSEQSSQVG